MMKSFTSTVTVVVTTLVVVIALCNCVSPSHGAAAEVFGFCQTGHGAMFQGGWVTTSGDNRCHRGMFGIPASDGSLFDTTSARCDLPNVSPTTGDNPTCSCLGVPQCLGGKACDFDCSCGINGTASATTVNSYFFGRPSATFSGTFYFEGGTADVECVMAIPTGQYVHGYTLALFGNTKTFECDSDKSDRKASSNWTCSVKPLLSPSALVDGSTFTQVFNIENAASRLAAVVSLTLAMFVVAASFSVHYIDMLA